MPSFLAKLLESNKTSTYIRKKIQELMPMTINNSREKSHRDQSTSQHPLILSQETTKISS